MDDKPVKRAAGGAAVMATIAVVFLLLPMIYLLAIGPIVWLHRRGYVNVDPGSFIARVYYPAEMAAQNCQPFARAIETYVSLWEPPPTAPNARYTAPVPTTAATPIPAPTPAAPASAKAEP
jgi:hypothetical protein